MVEEQEISPKEWKLKQVKNLWVAEYHCLDIERDKLSYSDDEDGDDRLGLSDRGARNRKKSGKEKTDRDKFGSYEEGDTIDEFDTGYYIHTSRTFDLHKNTHELSEWS